ncbi:PAC2 family protein [Brachybacterium sp. EF45031]|uniref:proteasome assembly chaperone family protein n=1 Tax=Brachybacterium sillae TaxID=2810536 RepID=UPI00217CF1C0|nr:PAC2 family protein [Brachybacterium sillae]MCS6712388.1 PAC2 family protein [Brachybacterium sillae]
MRDPRDLYSFASPEVIGAIPRGPLPLVHALPGIVDAGNACRIAVRYLRDSLRNVRVVTFDTDELIDYRGSRPQAVFNGSAYTEVEMPEIALYLVYDERDTPFLLLDGPEPDLQWRRFAEALIDLVEYFEVDRVLSMKAIPMAVPHTRPIGLIAHANDPSLLAGEQRRTAQDSGEIVIPAAFGTFLEKELERAGHPAMGYAAQVPHYLSRTDFPAGSLALLRRISDAAGLEIPLVDLGDLSDAAMAALDGTISDNDDARGIVDALEEQYDAVTQETGSAGLATTADLPTADELGDHFERFLAARQEPPEGGSSTPAGS